MKSKEKYGDWDIIRPTTRVTLAPVPPPCAATPPMPAPASVFLRCAGFPVTARCP